jgi:hypothetical protein
MRNLTISASIIATVVAAIVAPAAHAQYFANPSASVTTNTTTNKAQTVNFQSTNQFVNIINGTSCKQIAKLQLRITNFTGTYTRLYEISEVFLGFGSLNNGSYLNPAGWSSTTSITDLAKSRHAVQYPGTAIPPGTYTFRWQCQGTGFVSISSFIYTSPNTVVSTYAGLFSITS